MRGRFIVKGFAGEKKLSGTIAVRGAKNAALKYLAASVLFDDPLVLGRMPHIEDTHRMGELLVSSGARIQTEGEVVRIIPPPVWKSELDATITRRLRASIVLTGPMLAREGKVSFPFPGGCVLGERPIDLFLQGYRAMGATVEGKDGVFYVQTPKGKLTGTRIFFPFISVTATETLMLAATLAEGETILANAAMEPEIVALADMLNACGAHIRGAGTHEIRIEGTDGTPLRSKGKTFAMPPDRIEAGSFVVLAALAGKDVTVKECEPLHMQALLDILVRAGVSIETGKDFVRIRASEEPYKSVNVRTHEYPGFPTDMQAMMAVFQTQCAGEGTILETIFDGRFRYAEDLSRMGADITVMNPHRIVVRGPRALNRATLESPDLRAGLAYIIAAAVASGTSIIENAYAIDRGYERIEERFSALGLSIVREMEAGTLVLAPEDTEAEKVPIPVRKRL